MTTITNTLCEQPWFVLHSSRYWCLDARHPTIAHFYALQAELPEEMTFAVPDGCVEILFDCDASRPTARLCGTPLQAKRVELRHRHRYFGVRFKPGVIPGFAGQLSEELAEQEVDLHDLLPCATQMLEQISQADSLAEQARRFDTLAASCLARQSSALSHRLIDTILSHRGDIRIAQLESMSGYTGRTLQRQFRQDTGMTPKTFCRIIRCQAALSSLTTEMPVSFTDLALELGFTDQSHFLRDFKTLVSTTPNDYHRRVVRGAYRERIRVLPGGATSTPPGSPAAR